MLKLLLVIQRYSKMRKFFFIENNAQYKIDNSILHSLNAVIEQNNKGNNNK